MKENDKQNHDSLVTHVELNSIRYNNLVTDLSLLTERIEKIEVHVVQIKDSLVKKETFNNKVFGLVLLGMLMAGTIGFLLNNLY